MQGEGSGIWQRLGRESWTAENHSVPGPVFRVEGPLPKWSPSGPKSGILTPLYSWNGNNLEMTFNFLSLIQSFPVAF